jgi:hypothetical protein
MEIMDIDSVVGQLSEPPKLPIINWRLFAELTGFEEGVVQGSGSWLCHPG